MKLGIIAFPWPGRTGKLAASIEKLGLDALLLADSQNLLPEVWGQLMMAARDTERIELGPGVTNSVTRDAAVTASAALALHVESGGRAVVGIGRGDSAVQRLGKKPDRVASFERYLGWLQAYLAGDSIERDGFQSRLEWAAAFSLPKVPVEVTATGHKVIEAAARHADRICLAVGADPEHLTAMLTYAREAVRGARREGAVTFGAVINCAIDADVAVARDAIRGTAATVARFSAFQDSDLSRLPGPLRKAATYIREHYDMRHHTEAGAEHTRGIDDAFVDWFGIAGPVEHARTRFRELAAMGLAFVRVIPGSTGGSTDVTRATLAALGGEIAASVRTSDPSISTRRPRSPRS